jgi:signal transduction histidine kinase
MANVSHDLRTPLALIYSYAELMNDFPDEITPQQTQTIMDETKRLTSLVNDILDISQFETGIIELHNSYYCLTDNIVSTINRITELIKSNGYIIEFEHNAQIYVNTDEVKITQAFYNLLINAVNYSGEDKKITVWQLVSGDWVRIEISDNGEGITPENLPYVWDRYYKIDKKHKRAVTGTGLGLSIVKKIIDLHGSRYGVSSEIGKGSTFWFDINKNSAHIQQKFSQ